jgi:hypothetical protein
VGKVVNGNQAIPGKDVGTFGHVYVNGIDTKECEREKEIGATENGSEAQRSIREPRTVGMEVRQQGDISGGLTKVILRQVEQFVSPDGFSPYWVIG